MRLLFRCLNIRSKSEGPHNAAAAVERRGHVIANRRDGERRSRLSDNVDGLRRRQGLIPMTILTEAGKPGCITDTAGKAALLGRDAPEWDLLRMYVDLYKHHFDLFVKGYVVYLAIIGAVAGFVFRPETDPLTRMLLLAFAVLASVLATAAWVTAIVWSGAFAAEVLVVCRRLGDVRIPMFGTRVILILGTLGSLALTAGGIYLLAKYPR